MIEHTTMKTYGRGQPVDFQMESRQDGQLAAVVVSKLEFFSTSERPDQVALLGTVASTGISYPSVGVSQAAYTIPFAWPYGVYKAVWTFQSGGLTGKFHELFRVTEHSWRYTPVGKANYDFRFYPLQMGLKKDGREYLRVLCKELYDRTYVIKAAQYRMISVKSQYSIAKGDWADMVIENGNQLMVMVCTRDMQVGQKWFMQVKIDVDNGEVIVSNEISVTIS